MFYWKPCLGLGGLMENVLLKTMLGVRRLLENARLLRGGGNKIFRPSTPMPFYSVYGSALRLLLMEDNHDNE